MGRDHSDFSLKLFESLLAGGGIQALAGIAADYLGNPICVNSSQMVVLAVAGSAVSDDKQWSYLCSVDFSDHVRIEKIANEKDFGIGPKARINALEEKSRRMMSCCDGARATPCVFVHMLEYDHPFVDGDDELLELFANAAALAVGKADAEGLVAENQASAVIRKLIMGDDVSLEVVERTLFENAQFQRYQVVVVNPAEDASLEEQIIRLRLLPVDFPDAKWSLFGSRAVLLFKLREERAISEDLFSRLKKVMDYREQRCGVSLPFGNIGKLREYHRQAFSALRFAERWLQPKDNVVFFSDVALDCFFDIIEPTFDLRSLCHPFIDYLIRYDRKYETRWFHTLAIYVLSGEDAARASKILGIHRNTLKYRLGCIRKLGGRSDSSLLDDCFRAELSVRALLRSKPSLVEEYGIPRNLLFEKCVRRMP